MKRMLAYLVITVIGMVCASSGCDIVEQKKGIRAVDFLNFTYTSTFCSAEYGADGIGKSVKVRNGEFRTPPRNGNENDYVYFGVVDKKIIYGDLTNDDQEEAIVPVGCGASIANFGRNEIFIFTFKNKAPHLLARLTNRKMENDYKKYYRSTGDSLWSSVKSIKVEKGKIITEVFSEGPHCCPEHITKLMYHWDGKALVLSGKPERKKFVQ